MQQTTCAQHLATLRKAKIVFTVREGKNVHYSVNYSYIMEGIYQSALTMTSFKVIEPAQTQEQADKGLGITEQN